MSAPNTLTLVSAPEGISKGSGSTQRSTHPAPPSIGKNIRTMCKNGGISPPNLADLTKISLERLGRITNCDHPPTRGERVLIAKALECTVDELEKFNELEAQ